MSHARDQAKEPVEVAVGLASGSVKRGRLRHFDPKAATVEVVLRQRGQKGAVEIALPFPASRLAYVEFPLAPDAAAFAERLPPITLHVAGAGAFRARVRQEDLADPAGFTCYPEGPDGSPVAERFVYAHALRGREAAEPIGALLVKKGLVAEEQVNAGLEAQEQARQSPLGQILVEQKKVRPEDIDRAAALQARRAPGEAPLRLGEILVQAGLVTEEDIEQALAEQHDRQGKRLGEVLVDMGLVSEGDVARTLAEKFHLPFVNLDETPVDPAAIEMVPQGVIERYRVFPFRADDRSVGVAMSDPLAMEAIDMLRFSMPRRIEEFIAAPGQIERYIRTYVAGDERAEGPTGPTEDVAAILEQMDAEVEEEEEAPAASAAREVESAVTKLVDRIVIDAFQRRASDIHVEPNGRDQPVAIRMRVDGVCQLYQQIPAIYRAQIVSRIKVLANLDLAEKRRPQDGKIRLRLGRQRLELRVATLPTANGDEDVVMRLLSSTQLMDLADLGLSARNLRVLRGLAAEPYGLLLVVGPTGSGKTTTLHAVLKHINTPERKIWTAEDPIEITQPGLRQVQVNGKVDLTFAAALRSFLRADPDVIMVGEMRDRETAQMGVEASLTGHLVLSTLHTNSAPETVVRLLEMGIDAFVFGDALLGVLAQRLARRLCPRCRVVEEATAEERGALAEAYGGEAALEAHLGGEAPRIGRPRGCERCGGSGFTGRVALHELMPSDDALRAAIVERAPAERLRELAMERGMRTLLQDGVEKCLAGETDLARVRAVCR